MRHITYRDGKCNRRERCTPLGGVSKRKDALFLAVLATALDEEAAFIEQCFATGNPAAAPGPAYCARLAQRYRASPHLQFLLRTVCAPPEAVRSAVQAGYLAVLDPWKPSSANDLPPRPAGGATATNDDLAQCYLGIIDRLHVELVYGQEAAAERRREALWAMFGRELLRQS